MKKNVTYIACDKFIALAVEAGFIAVVQSGFIRVSGPTGRRLYIANTKRVGRVDLSGFTLKHRGVVDLGDAAFCNVKQKIDFSRSESDILLTFKSALRALVTSKKKSPKLDLVTLPVLEAATEAAPEVHELDAEFGLMRIESTNQLSA